MRNCQVQQSSILIAFEKLVNEDKKRKLHPELPQELTEEVFIFWRTYHDFNRYLSKFLSEKLSDSFPELFEIRNTTVITRAVISALGVEYDTETIYSSEKYSCKVLHMNNILNVLDTDSNLSYGQISDLFAGIRQKRTLRAKSDSSKDKTLVKDNPYRSYFRNFITTAWVTLQSHIKNQVGS